MRSLFALLLVANLALAGWYLLRAAPPAAQRTRAPAVPSIELVGERPLDLRRAAAAPSWSSKAGAWESRATAADARTERTEGRTEFPIAGRSAAVPPNCISIGPFRDDAAAEDAADTLAAAGYSPSKRSAEEDFWIGYWVYIEDLASDAEAREVAAQMRDGGIADAYVVSDEELGTLVSLGVFSEERRSDRQRETARSIGREPTVVERTRRAAVSWLDVNVSGEPSIDLQTLQPAESSAALRLEACPDHVAP